MPVQTSYPGVYVQEVPSGVRTITGVSTSITVFLGRAIWGPVNKPVLCLNYTDFKRNFTLSVSQGELARAVRLFFLNGGTNCYVMRIANSDALVANLTLQDDSSDDSLIITSRYPGELGNDLRIIVEHDPDFENLFNLTLYRAVLDSSGAEAERQDLQTWIGLSMDPTHPRFAINYVKYDWAILWQVGPNTNRPAEIEDSLTEGKDGATLTAKNYEDAYPILDREVDLFNIMVLPRNSDGVEPKELWANASVFCQRKRAFLLIDPEESWTNVKEATNSITGVNGLRIGLVNDHSAIFFPRLTLSENNRTIQMGPSGAIAGLMARIDSSRGVWKAPAGTEADLRGIKGLEHRLTDLENGILNPKGINTLRIFPSGIVNWGARTMDGDDDFASEWKYIPVRRTALFIEESLYRGLKWVVFEPNDEPLWAQIRLNVGAFMHNLFRQGAFQGKTKQDAYFVKCDKETTPDDEINLGRVNIWVGFAPLKPAEFVILYLQQITGQIQV